MQTLQTPVSQIISPNATPAPASRAQPSTGGADGDFQRTLNRQMEQRQASRNAVQAPASRPGPATAKSAPVQTPAPTAKAPAAEAKPAAPTAEEPVADATQAKPAGETATPTGKDNVHAEETTPATIPALSQPQADQAAAMLALMGNIQLAMQQGAAVNKTAPGSEAAPAPAPRMFARDEDKSLAATHLLASSPGGKDAIPAMTSLPAGSQGGEDTLPAASSLFAGSQAGIGAGPAATNLLASSQDGEDTLPTAANVLSGGHAGIGAALAAATFLASGQVGKGAIPAVATLPTGSPIGKGAAPAAAGEFADSLEQAQGKAATAPQSGASLQGGKVEAGKLAIDAQLAATAKTGPALSEAVPKEPPVDLSRLAAPLQPGALQQAAAAVAVPADKLAGRVGTPAWDQQLGQKVVWMAAGGDQSAILTLNPPDLGPLQVVLTVTNDQADAAFMSAQPEVRQALEAAMPRLREMMSEAGIAFGGATVSAGTPEQQNNRGASGGRRGHGQGGTGAISASGEIVIAPAAGGRARASLGTVDTFA